MPVRHSAFTGSQPVGKFRGECLPAAAAAPSQIRLRKVFQSKGYRLRRTIPEVPQISESRLTFASRPVGPAFSQPVKFGERGYRVLFASSRSGGADAIKLGGVSRCSGGAVLFVVPISFARHRPFAYPVTGC